jgi:pimeloyl-ACP methyl ester carboxylesterase
VPAHDRFISINGLRLHYREWGRSSPSSVVLLHGGSAHAHWWDFFAEAIGESRHVLALDLRGHGDSDRPDPPAYRVEDYANDLAVLLAKADIAQVDLIGHSLGALVATAYAGCHAQRVNSLVLVDSQVKITPAGARYMMRLRHFPHVIYPDRADAVRRFRLLPTPTHADPKILAHVAAHGVRQLPDGRWTPKFDRTTLAHGEPQDLTHVLAQLRCPILFVRGAHSTFFSPVALAAVLQAVPHAESVEIPNAHHHVMLDSPGEFARAVRAFLERSAPIARRHPCP